MIATPLCLLIFLGQSTYFADWEGHAVSVRPTRDATPSVYTVLIVNDDGSTHERNWKADTVESLVLPVDALAMAPRDISDRPRTKKTPYTLTYSVQPAIKIEGLDEDSKTDEEAEEKDEAPPAPEPAWTDHGTTSPQGLAIALITWIVGLGLRNMFVSGSPFDLIQRKRYRVEEQKASGSVAQGQRASRSQKGMPGQQTSRKRKRRPR